MRHGLNKWVGWVLGLIRVQKWLVGAGLVIMMVVGVGVYAKTINGWQKAKEENRLNQVRQVLGIRQEAKQKERKEVERRLEYWNKVVEIQPNYKQAYEKIQKYGWYLGEEGGK